MVRVEHEITLHNDVDELFSYIANPENNPIWDKNTYETEQKSESAIGVGTTGQITRTFLGRSYETNFTYEAYDPPHLVSHQITAGPIEVETTNGLKELENGTQISLDLKVRFKGLKKLMEPFFARRIRKQVGENLEELQLYFRLKSL